ncbi:MAG: DUF5060 domain-containing protein [Muribaculaceae bacterium]|nr:DUF5060 domain-containing protein [Muribaculaceae bacterium]
MRINIILLAVVISFFCDAAEAGNTVEQWRIFEQSFRLKTNGNPFDDVTVKATFINGPDTVRVKGFYDGDDIFKVRFMPNKSGLWKYRIAFDGIDCREKTGSLKCVPARAGNHGPVRADSIGFAYADGARYIPVGTTCYAWAHQPDELKRLTVETLGKSCFNKLRMCVFPKSYDWNHNEPELYPFEGEAGHWDFSRPNPEYFRNIEQCISSLDSLGIEADIIVYHPYDRWGFSSIGLSDRDRYMQYLISRLGAWKNVWWSMANEYDFMNAYTDEDWKYHLRFFAKNDPYGHLRSIHNGVKLYDHNDPNITHVSIQASDTGNGGNLRSAYGKPVIYDECRYEGNIPWVWGTMSAEEMVQKFWTGFMSGGFVGHGEVLLTDNSVAPDKSDEVLWWSKGGILRGKSHGPIRFLKEILEKSPEGAKPVKGITGWQDYPTLGCDNKWFLIYTGRDIHCQMMLELPEDHDYEITLIDTWNMQIIPVEGLFRGRSIVPIRESPYMAIMAIAIPD